MKYAATRPWTLYVVKAYKGKSDYNKGRPKPFLYNSFINFIIYSILMSFVIVSLLPKLITPLQRKLWNLLSFKVKDQSAKEVVENSFRTRPDKINADVVVFGHTHIADTYHLPSGWTFNGLRRFLKLFYSKKQSEEGREKRFVNTGCWVSPENDKDLSVPRNTFAYIDNTGIYLFKWEGKNKDPICVDCFSI